MEYHVTIKKMPAESRPRERMALGGPQALSAQELLAILLGTGNRYQSAIDVAAQILSDLGGLRGLALASLEDFSQVKGIGLAKATQIAAALELGKRISAVGFNERPRIDNPQVASSLVMEEMRHLDREHFRIMILNTKHQVISVETISIGSLNASIVHPREVFKHAMRKSAAALILVHNHPSGDPSPSSEDLNVTKRLMDAGILLGIEILDHIIIGDNKFYSMKDKGII